MHACQISATNTFLNKNTKKTHKNLPTYSFSIEKEHASHPKAHSCRENKFAKDS